MVGVLHRRRRTVRRRLGAWQGWDFGSQYFAGYLVEKSLSVDNLFVFLSLLKSRGDPAARAHAGAVLGTAAVEHGADAPETAAGTRKPTPSRAR